MIDLDYLKKIKLVTSPMGQQIVASLLLFPNYRIFANVDIQIENIERIPRNENVIFAMNHTDRFNYWPFQYKLWSMKCFSYATVWVKGKYYRNALLAKGLDLCNLIPVPSMGYLIEEFYRKKFKQRLDKSVYRDIKDIIDGKYESIEAYPKKAAEALNALGGQFADFVRGQYELIMERVAELSRTALSEKRLNLIIFPEGTRGTPAGGRKNQALRSLHYTRGRRSFPSVVTIRISYI